MFFILPLSVGDSGERHEKTSLNPAACTAGPAAAVSGAGYGRIRRTRHLAAAYGIAAAADVGAGHHQHAAVLFGFGHCRAGCPAFAGYPGHPVNGGGCDCQPE